MKPSSNRLRSLRPRRTSRLRPSLEGLEARLVLSSTNVLTFHNDFASTGLNAAETQLTPANVKVGSFGKLFAVPMDGQVYAQPLVDTGVTISNGPNTTAGAAGLHDVVFVATEHDSLYAVDSANTGTGAVLWKRTFLDATNPGSGSQTNVNNTLNATAITSVPNGDVGSSDISPEIGITGTPVIDPSTNVLYVVVKTKETIGGNAHYVQRLHAINIADGTDKVTPFLIGDTTNGNTNNTNIYVYGTGDGSVTDPYNSTGKGVVQFNAYREHQRGALNLVNNTVYVEWASHGDNGPYHGFVAKWNVSNLSTTGFGLTGVLCTSPNNGLSGIWQGGGRLAFESNGSAFYFETGNGSGGAPTLNASGFPTNANYTESLVKVVADPTSTATSQNPNGWGLKVADYFTPFNVAALDGADQDFGSGAPMILPDSAGLPNHPHLMVASGKEGKIYLVDRDNMGKFDPNNDHVLNAVPDGSGHNTPPVQLGGSLSTAAYYNGTIYWVSGYSSNARSYTIQSDGTLSIGSTTAVGSFGYLPGSPSISSNGTTGGIVWIADRNANQVHAYDATTLATELWNSGQKAGGADNVGAVVKLAAPTEANGELFVGTTSGLVVYGLTPPASSPPAKPTNVTASALSGTSVQLSWQDPTTSPNSATGYNILQSLDGTTFTQATTAAAGATSISIGGLQTTTTYYYEVQGFNGLGNSPASAPVSVTTTNVVPALDFSGGFTGATSKLTLNGATALNGTKLELTNGGGTQAASAFSTSPLDVTRFSSQFTFQLTAGASTADGFTFTIQSNAATSIGPAGGGLGYGPDTTGGAGGIPNSVAVKFDLYSNQGEGVDSTGLYTGGVAPTNVGSIDLTPSGVDLHSGDLMQVNMSYDGTTLSVIIKDTQTGKSATQNYIINIPTTLGNSTAFVGFTAGTGGLTATQDILSWSFSPNAPQAPSAPSGLGATPATDTSVLLSWTNNATNQTGYHLDRATDSGFTQGLLTQSITASATSFPDTATGIAPGSTFYYRLRAFNTAGDSANSNVASVTIPLAPPKPSNAAVVSVSSTEIDLNWLDNAGRAASNYIILRQANGAGGFVQVATLPSLNATPPTTYPTWADTNLAPGSYYEYHIEAINTSGHNDFTGTNATTITLAPSGLTAVAGTNLVNLSWTALAAYGGLTYNVYRGTTPGGEGATPLANGLATASYTDTTAAAGTTYYYEVTAVNANSMRSPVLPSESAFSLEVSARPLGVNLPPAPANLSSSVPFNSASSKVVLTWTTSAGATSYNVYRSLNGGGETGTPLASNITATTFTDVTAAFGTTYFYKVTAVGAGGESAKSNETSATPLFLSHVNFTNSTGQSVPNYLADIGLAYSNGTRANGLKYGWNIDNTANARNRNASNSPDELHDSLNHMQKPNNPNAWWGIAVPNGTYSVHLISGDPTAYDSVFKINVGGALSGSTVTGGTLAINGQPSSTVRWLENTVTVTVTGGVLYVSNAAGSSNNKIDEIDITQVLPGVNYAGGFTSTAGLQLNGGTWVKQNGTALQLTDGGVNEAASAFATTPVGVAKFSTNFSFQLSSGSTTADGFTFAIQGVGPTALGSTGGGLGFGTDGSNPGTTISKSVAVKFDLFSNGGEGSNSIGVFTNGASPTLGGIAPISGLNDLTGSGIDFHSGHVFNVKISYDGNILTVTVTDATTSASISRSYAVDFVSAVGGPLGYVGFTAGTGGQTATQSILNWSFTPVA